MEFLQKLTLLPIQVLQITISLNQKLLVTTPHKGIVEIMLKDRQVPMFGSPTEFDKNFEQIISQIKQLEKESTTYLLNKWKDNITQNDNK